MLIDKWKKGLEILVSSIGEVEETVVVTLVHSLAWFENTMHIPSSSLLHMLVREKEIWLWRKTPNMSVAWDSVVGLDIFEPNTQTWEPFTWSGAKIQFNESRSEDTDAKLLVESNENGSVYDLKERKWDFEPGLCKNNTWEVCDIKCICHCNR